MKAAVEMSLSSEAFPGFVDGPFPGPIDLLRNLRLLSDTPNRTAIRRRAAAGQAH
jgi:hypothetical protein